MAQIFQATLIGPVVSKIAGKKMGNVMAQPTKPTWFVLKS